MAKTLTQALERSNGEYSMQSLERRIRLNRESGWGLEKGTPAQLNLLALFCQKHHLLPGDDVTLYEGKPWITVDGRVKLLRRNPEYHGFKQRPLSKAEKEEWGWYAKDIVIETTIRTLTYGEVIGYGRVSSEEAQGQQVQGVRHNPVARVQPVEMAMKRSLARAERFAFGTESLVDDEDLEDAARTVIEERNDPEKVKRNSDRYQEIFEPEEKPPADMEQADEDMEERIKESEQKEVERQRKQEGLI